MNLNKKIMDNACSINFTFILVSIILVFLFILPTSDQNSSAILYDGTKAAVSITFEHAFSNQLTAINENTFDMNTTFAVIVQRVGISGYMTQQQLLDLQNKGFEITSHSETHTKISKSTPPDQLYYQTVQSKLDLEKMGFKITGFIPPSNIETAKSFALIQSNYGWTEFFSPVTFLPKYISPQELNYSKQNFGIYDEPIWGIGNGDQLKTFSAVKSQIDYAIANKLWIAIKFHGIDNSGGKFDTSPIMFHNIIQYIKDQRSVGNLLVLTRSEGVGLIDTGKIGDPTPPTLNINSPANNTSTFNSAVHVTGNSSDNIAVQSVKYKIDDASPVTNASGTTDWSFTTDSLSTGSHTIWVKATDSANNTTTKLLGITITEPSTITGTVYDDTNNNGLQDNGESAIEGAKVIAVDLASPGKVLQKTTDRNGTYLFDNVTTGHAFLVQVSPVSALHLQLTGLHLYNYATLSQGQNSINFPLFPITGANHATINGTVFEDTNNDGIQDTAEKGLDKAQVFVVDFLTLTQETVQTDINGHYTAVGILPNNVLVQVAPVPAGHLPSTGRHSFAYPPTLGMGSTTTINFPLRPVSPSELMTIHARVFNDTNGNGIQDNGETGLAGVQVFSFVLLTAEQQNKFTNGTGDLTFNGITPDVTLVQQVTPPGLAPTSPVGTLGFRYFDFPSVSPGANLTESFGLH